MATTTHVFVVQRGTALYERYEDKFIGVVGIFATLEDANRAVQACQREFMKESGIEETTDDGDFAGFCYEDRGGLKDGGTTQSPAGTPVGLYWEFDDGACWYSCGIECFPVLGSGS